MIRQFIVTLYFSIIYSQDSPKNSESSQNRKYKGYLIKKFTLKRKDSTINKYKPKVISENEIWFFDNYFFETLQIKQKEWDERCMHGYKIELIEL